MKSVIFKITQASDNNFALLLLRSGAALMMLTHGIPKLMRFFSGEPVEFASVMGLSMAATLSLAVFAEVFCSVCVVLGLGTRLASVPLVITMLTAAFYIHAADPFAGREMALLYALIFIVLTITGGGRYSVDHILYKRLMKKQGDNKFSTDNVAS